MVDKKYPHANLAGKAKHAFEKANPVRYGKVQKDPEAAAALRTIDNRVDHIKRRMHAHFKRSQNVWITREAIDVWRKRSALTAKHPSPFNFMRENLTSRSIMQEAKRRVAVRMTKRLSKVNEMQTRMQNAAVKTRQYQKQDKELSLARRSFNIEAKKMKRNM